MHLIAETKPHQLNCAASVILIKTPHLLIIFLASDCINNLNLGVIVQGNLGQQLVIFIISDKQHCCAVLKKRTKRKC